VSWSTARSRSPSLLNSCFLENGRPEPSIDSRRNDSFVTRGGVKAFPTDAILEGIVRDEKPVAILLYSSIDYQVLSISPRLDFGGRLAVNLFSPPPDRTLSRASHAPS